MVAPVTLALVLLPFALAAALVGAVAPRPDNGDTRSSDPDGRQSLSLVDLTNLPMDNKTSTVPKQKHMDLQCRSLRMKMTISDGVCTSIKPVSSILCVGHCLPEGDLPWYAQTLKIWSQSKKVEFRCEDDVVKRKRVELVCENGLSKTISLKVVRSCKCTRYNTEQNRPLSRNYGLGSLDYGSEQLQGKNNDPRTRRKNKKDKRKRRKNKRRKNRRRDRRQHRRTPSEL